jgi:hypothetical protein
MPTVPNLVLLALALAGVSGITATAATSKPAGAQQQAKQYASFKPCDWPQLDTAIEHFSEVLQFHTIGNASHPDHADPVVWELLDLWLHETYSSVLSTFTIEKVCVPLVFCLNITSGTSSSSSIPCWLCQLMQLEHAQHPGVQLEHAQHPGEGKTVTCRHMLALCSA